VDGKEVRQELPLVKGNKGKAPTIKATPDGKFILADKETGLAPENITVRRVGKNLHVFLEGEPFEHPTVIIEDFFEYNCELVGMAEGGAYYAYVSSDGDDDFAGALALQDGESSALVLGGDMAAGDVDRTAFGLLPWIVGGALGAGAGVGAINSNSGGGSKSAPAPSAPAPIAPAPVLKHALDNEGSIQGVILSGGKTDDTTPTFAGTGQKPGNTISIYDNGKKIGETKVAEDGSWSFTPEKPLTEGKHSITFVERGADGRDSEVSKPFEFTVDTTAPEASPIGGILDDVGVKTGQLKPGESTDDQRPTLSGKTEGNSVVEIYDNGKKIGETRADAEGNWSFTPKEPLEEGEHSLTTRVIDEAGNVSDPSDSWDLVIDITPPVLPEDPIAEIIDNQGDSQGPIGKDGITDDSKPTLKGNGNPGDTVIILDNGKKIGEVEVGEDGTWAFTPETDLGDGDHGISVIIEDPAGNQSEPSDEWVITVDTQAPNAPTIGSVLDDVGAKTGELASGDVTDDQQPTLAGSAEAGALVEIYDNGKKIGETRADANGNWSFTPEQPLAEGPHSLTTRAIDQAGNVSEPSDAFELVIDITAPEKPGNGGEGPGIGEIIDDQGSITGPIENGGVTDDTSPTLKGNGNPGDTIIILDNGKPIGEVEVGEDGTWAFTPEIDLGDGDHGISVIIEDPAGNQSEPSDEWVITVDTQAPNAPTIGSVLDDVGAKTGELASGDATDDQQPTLAGAAEAGALVEIYDNGKKIGETRADANGNWSFTPEQPLAEGPHSLTTRAIDQAGNVSEPSDAFELVIDITAPEKPGNGGEGPGISEIIDDSGSITGPIENGGVTDDTTPTLKGNGNPGDTIIILDNGKPIGEVEVGEDGTWAFTPETDLGDGDHGISVIIEDPAGNQSEPSDEWVITVDTQAPDTPIIGSVYDDVGTRTGELASGDMTDDSQPTINGTAEAGSIVELFDNGVKIGQTQANEQGAWSYTPEKPLASGSHAITAQATDAAGNVSAQSPAFDFVLIAPNAPVPPAINSVIDDVGTIQGPLQKNDATDDARPTLHGSAAPGVIISVYSNGVLLGTTTADDQGQWSFTPGQDLPEGLNNLTVTATDLAGNVIPGSETGAYPLVIDTVRPNPVESGELLDDVGAIQGPIAQGDTTDDAQPTFQGTSGEPDATVVIYDNGLEIGRVKTDRNGNWSFTPNPALADGEHSLSVELIDRAGNVGDRSEPIDFTVDTRSVEVSIDAILDDHGSKQGPIAKGGVTDDETPQLSGRATPNATVVIYDNGVEIGRTESDTSGNWSFTSPQLDEGDHAFSASVITEAGGESARSPEFDFRLDLTPPSKPGPDGHGIDEVIDDVGSIKGPIESGGVTDDTTPTLNGTGESGDTIHIYDNGNLIGSAPVKPDGTWSFTPPPLSEGEHEITVIIEDEAGNSSEPSDPWVVNVDTQAPNAPTIGSVLDDVGAKTGELASGDVTDDQQPTLAGSAEAGALVEIYDNGKKIGETRADANGNWSFTPEQPLAEGPHSLTVRAIDQAGNSSEPSDAFELVIDITAPEKPGTDPEGPGIGEIIDDQGSITGPIENGGVTDDSTPTIKGQGNPGDTIIILDNGKPIGEVEVGEDGTWAFTPETDLGDGEHGISVIIQDPAGNQSEPSDEWVVTVDTQAPTAPTIGSVLDDVGAETGELASGDVTDDQQPTLAGTAEAGALVEILDNGVKIGETRADTNGNWSFTPEQPLAEGPHSLTTRAIDQAGNVSEPSDAFDLVIDLDSGSTPPSIPVIDSVYDDAGGQTGNLLSGDVTDDTRPRISGSSDPLATVVIYNDGKEIGRSQADAQGNWSFTPESELANGVYNFTAVAENAAGRSEPSEPFELIIYTGNGPIQVARLSHMGKDSGHDGQDFVTDNGSFGRLMHGVLSAELAAGQSLQVSTDGGTTWFDALVNGTDWAAQDLNAHTDDWTIQTRVVGADGKTGFVMEQQVVLDTYASRAPSSIQLEGTSLLVAFDPSDVAVGDRIAVIADGGAQRFEYTLTEVDIIAGSVSLEVGAISSASAALVDQSGNLSGYANTGSNPSVNAVLTGDVSEVYGTTKDNVFTIGDVSVLENIKVIEGNAGVDTLKLAGANQVLDLSAWEGRLSSIEVIDITGSGDNTLKVSLGDVLDLGHRGAFISDDSVQLAIKGNAGDTVELSDLLPNGMDVGDWELLGDVTAAGVVYEVYHHTELAAEILVQQGVTVQF
jgi:hypothetical protein